MPDNNTRAFTILSRILMPEVDCRKQCKVKDKHLWQRLIYQDTMAADLPLQRDPYAKTHMDYEPQMSLRAGV